MKEPSRAVFLSYASQDAETAVRISAALRAAGIEVWIDQSELRGGDAWDASIRSKIHECALFVPIISRTTQVRTEGYFRLEWRLADERTHLMADGMHFLMPVDIDHIPEKSALVPKSFLNVQWTRLGNGADPREFVERVQGLLLEKATPRSSAQWQHRAPSGDGPTDARASTFGDWGMRQLQVATVTLLALLTAVGLFVALRLPMLWPALLAIATIGLALLGLVSYRKSRQPVKNSKAWESARPANPSVLSIAVLPFSNHTGDPAQAYLADGLTASVTADLVRISDARVVNGATAFAYRDRTAPLSQLGIELGVRFVLQGSVQRSANRIRINAHLGDTLNGAQAWSETFEGDQSDLFALQDSITTRIRNSTGRAMVILAARETESRVESLEVSDLLLRARALSLRPQSLDLLRREEALYREVLKREPDHPEGLTGLAYSLLLEAHNFGSKLEGTVRQRCYEEGGNLARRAREVDPDNPRVYGLLSIYAISHDDYPGALHADEEAYRLDPRNIRVCNGLAVTLLRGAQAQRAIELLTRAIGLDPVHPYDMLFFNLGWAHFMLGDFVAAIDWLERALLRNAAYPNTTAYLAMSHAMLGDVSRAKEMVKKTREIDPAFGYSSLSKIGTTTPAAFARWREGPFTEAWKRAGLPD